MKAYLSNTLDVDNDKAYVITSIAIMLDDIGYYCSESPANSEEKVDRGTVSSIRTSNLFLGLMTNDGNKPNNVYNEWKVAIKYRVPSILLVEDSLDFSRYEFDENYRSNVIRFSRKNPEVAISQIKQRIQQSRIEPNPKRMENIVAWLTGGNASMQTIRLLAS